VRFIGRLKTQKRKTCEDYIYYPFLIHFRLFFFIKRDKLINFECSKHYFERIFRRKTDEMYNFNLCLNFEEKMCTKYSIRGKQSDLRGYNKFLLTFAIFDIFVMNFTSITNLSRKIVWHKIARPHRKPFGLFYPLEKCFSSHFLIHFVINSTSG